MAHHVMRRIHDASIDLMLPSTPHVVLIPSYASLTDDVGIYSTPLSSFLSSPYRQLSVLAFTRPADAGRGRNDL